MPCPLAAAWYIPGLVCRGRGRCIADWRAKHCPSSLSIAHHHHTFYMILGSHHHIHQTTSYTAGWLDIGHGDGSWWGCCRCWWWWLCWGDVWCVAVSLIMYHPAEVSENRSRELHKMSTNWWSRESGGSGAWRAGSRAANEPLKFSTIMEKAPWQRRKDYKGRASWLT